jgi:hypothetical protein
VSAPVAAGTRRARAHVVGTDSCAANLHGDDACDDASGDDCSPRAHRLATSTSLASLQRSAICQGAPLAIDVLCDDVLCATSRVAPALGAEYVVSRNNVDG